MVCIYIYLYISIGRLYSGVLGYYVRNGESNERLS